MFVLQNIKKQNFKNMFKNYFLKTVFENNYQSRCILTFWDKLKIRGLDIIW